MIITSTDFLMFSASLCAGIISQYPIRRTRYLNASEAYCVLDTFIYLLAIYRTMKFPEIHRYEVMVAVFGMAGAVAILTILYMFGATTNTITIAVAIAMITMMVITTAVTEKAIRGTALKSLGSLESIKTGIEGLKENQDKFFTRIYQHLDQALNVKPSITLRRESRPFALFCSTTTCQFLIQMAKWLRLR